MSPHLVAIHQPNFWPWLGFFDKIVRSDTFILLDDAQIQKTGGSWVNRVQAIVSGKVGWLTVPIVRGYHGVSAIRDVRIDASKPWREHMLRSVELSYRTATHFQEAVRLFEQQISFPTDKIAELNINAILTLCGILEIETTRLTRASDLAVHSRGTGRLIDLTTAAGGDAYLSGGGAVGYQEDDQFSERGIQLLYQQYAHPTYTQGSASVFTPGLSILDALMHHGIAGTRQLLGC